MGEAPRVRERVRLVVAQRPRGDCDAIDLDGDLVRPDLCGERHRIKAQLPPGQLGGGGGGGEGGGEGGGGGSGAAAVEACTGISTVPLSWRRSRTKVSIE